MAGERRLRILSLLVGQENAGFETKRLCDVCAQVTGMSGAGIMLMTGDEPRGSVCTTDTISARIEELQYTLGEGPCIDVYQLDHPIMEPDLVDPIEARWLAFSASAVDVGARAVFGFPLQVGAVRLGAMNLYCDRPGAMSDDQYADALVMADIAAQALLVLQSHASPGILAAELEAGGDYQYVVHQASGMVAAQLGVGVGQSLVRLRARAFAEGRPLAELAGDVVARRVRFHHDRSDGTTP